MPLLPVGSGAFHKPGGESAAVGKAAAGREVLPGAQEQVFRLFLPLHREETHGMG